MEITLQIKRGENKGHWIVQFAPAFSQLAPQDFVQQYIVGLRCKPVVAGFDFTFGYKQGNDEATDHF
jgi:riboflavin kinase / FMN adenylyltransferase